MDGVSPTLVDSGLATLYTRRSFANETWEFVAFVTPQDTNDLSQNDNYGGCSAYIQPALYPCIFEF